MSESGITDTQVTQYRSSPFFGITVQLITSKRVWVHVERTSRDMVGIRNENLV